MEFSAWRSHRIAVGVGLTAVLALVGSGCSTTDNANSNSAGLNVVTSFYPLEFLATEIGGDLVTVTNLTPSGGEPHDLELAPATVRKVDDADLVLFMSGFQPAVDQAISPDHSGHTLDIAGAADLKPYTELGSEHFESDEDADDHDHGPLDPHFWLDPNRLAQVAKAVGPELAQTDPDNAKDYAARTDTLVTALESLDKDFATGLASCKSDTIVTTHAAFGYLADRFGLQEIGISGIDPDLEPSPARLREVGEQIADHDLSTIFYESTGNAKVADVLAKEFGLESAVLDPLETLNDSESDYLSIMKINLTTLRTALSCS